MALGSTRIALANSRGPQVFPCSLSSEWQTAIDAGGVTVQDAATILNPATEITAATRHIIRRNNHAGTLVKVRMRYVGSVSQSPIVAVFGRSGNDPWEVLYNQSDGTTAALTAAPSTDIREIVGGVTYLFTLTSQDHTFDCNGCDEILVGIQTVVAGGTTASDSIQVKII